MNFKKIGLDFHGVVDQDFEFFREFAQLAQQRGFLVFVISGGHLHSLQTKLQKNRIPYNGIYAMWDYFIAAGVANSRDEVPEEVWNTQKGEYCAQAQIDFHIDDSKMYTQYFKTPFCVYDNSERICEYGNQIIKIETPAHFLMKIENYLNN